MNNPVDEAVKLKKKKKNFKEYLNADDGIIRGFG